MLVAAALISCGGPPDAYAPSVPRKPIDVFGTGALHAWVRMNSEDAPVSIVRGVAPDVQAGAWRWASPHAELRFFIDAESSKGWKAKADYTIPRVLLEQTGPVRLTFLVNNTPLDSIRHDHEGMFTWEKPVPASVLVADGMNYLRIEADKSISGADGPPMSFILSAAGFVR